MSSPGFEKSFVTLQDLGAELERYICSECTGTNAHGESAKMDLEGMLGTPCGCEFELPLHK